MQQAALERPLAAPPPRRPSTVKAASPSVAKELYGTEKCPRGDRKDLLYAPG